MVSDEELHEIVNARWLDRPRTFALSAIDEDGDDGTLRELSSLAAPDVTEWQMWAIYETDPDTGSQTKQCQTLLPATAPVEAVTEFGDDAVSELVQAPVSLDWQRSDQRGTFTARTPNPLPPRGNWQPQTEPISADEQE